MASLLVTSPAAAGFRYLPPAEARSAAASGYQAGTLGAAVKRLAPPGILLRYDVRVDPGRRVLKVWKDWPSLMSGEGLASSRHGEEIRLRPAELAAHAVELRSEPRRVWRIRPGETLRTALSRWGEKAGVAVLFLTDRDWRLHQGRVFRSGFVISVFELFCSLSHMPRAPVGEMAEDGETLSIRHRSFGSSAACRRPTNDGGKDAP